MAQPTLSRVLEDIRTLETEELHQVKQAIDARLSSFGYSPEEEAALRDLVAAGLLKEIKPRRRENREEPPLVPIQGKPLSESIIEERR